MQKSLFKIRLLLHDMEKQLGLTQLTSVERDVLYVIESLAEKQEGIASHEILSHELIENISRPTIYRALTRLLEENLIVKSTFADRGFFSLPSQSSNLSQEQMLRQASSAMLAHATASEQTELALA